MLQGHESILKHIGKVLRAHDDDITHEPVPTTWVDLIYAWTSKREGARRAVNRTPSGAFRARLVRFNLLF